MANRVNNSRTAKKAKSSAGSSKRKRLSGKKSARKSSPKRCYLLEMPPEVRNRIFELVLYEPKGVEVGRIDQTSSKSHHALSRTNRQLNEECGKRFFGINTFIFRLGYTNDPSDPDWLWEGEREGFNEFIEFHVADLRSVHIYLGEDTWRNNATYFFENVKPLRTSLRRLLNNDTELRFIAELDLIRCSVSFDLILADRDVAETEIEKQVCAAMAQYGHTNPEKEVEAMQAVIGNTLFGVRKDEGDDEVDEDEDAAQ